MAKNWFLVEGLAPIHDPRWLKSTPGQKLAFFRVCRELVLQQFDLQLSRGIGQAGIGLVALSPKTIKYRKSKMGPADPNAPPLTPAHELSRTRSYVDARVMGNAIQVYWRRGWGRILGYHRDGSRRLPSRDVIGLAPDYKQEVQKQAHFWWAAFIKGLPVRAPIRPKQGVPARPMVAVQPGYQPKQAVGPQPTTTTNVVIGGDIYSMSSGSAKELMGAIKAGTFTGFRSYAR
jgi:hypothetical protein